MIAVMPQPAGHVPDGVAVQQLLLTGVGPFGDDPGGPAFEPAQLLIACGQRPDGDQDAAQVLDRLARGKLETLSTCAYTGLAA